MYGYRAVGLLALWLSAIPASVAANCASACAQTGYRTSPDATPLATLTTPFANDCAKICQYLPSCNSFSYATRNKQCILSRKTLGEQGWNARARGGERSGARDCLLAQCVTKPQTVTITQSAAASTIISTTTATQSLQPSTVTIVQQSQPSTITISNSIQTVTQVVTEQFTISNSIQTITQTAQPSTVTETSPPTTIMITTSIQAPAVTTTEIIPPTTVTIIQAAQASTVTTTATTTVSQSQTSTPADSCGSSTSSSSTTAAGSATSTSSSATSSASSTSSSASTSTSSSPSSATSSSSTTISSSTQTQCNSPPTSVNAILNPSFESGLGPWITVGTPGKTVLDTTDQAFDGSTSVSMSTGNGLNQFGSITFVYAYLQQTVYTVPGVTYKFSYNYKPLQTETGFFGCGININFNNQNVGYSQYNTTSAQWLQNSFNYQPTSNVTVIQIVPTCGLFGGGTQQVLLDNFSLQGTVNCAQASCAFSASNVATNPGFDSGDPSGAPWALSSGASISQGGYDNTPYAASLISAFSMASRSQSTATLSQSLTGLSSGSTYNVAYYYNVPSFIISGAGGQCDLTSLIDDQQILNTAFVGGSSSLAVGSNGWALTQGSFTATKPSQVLSFKWNCPQSGTTVTALLDSISVVGNSLVCTATLGQ